MTRRWLFLFVLLGVAGALLFPELPIAASYGRTMQDAGHMPLFALLTLGVCFVLRDDPRWTGAGLYLLAGIVGLGAGLLTEVIQKPLARDASWEDVFSNTIGTVFALAVYAVFERRSGIQRAHRVAALVVALLCTAIYVAPIATKMRAYVHDNGQVSVLAE
jgi:hypothetical protein